MNYLNKKSINDISFVASSFVLVRVDWSVPIDKEGTVVDNFRIVKTLETIKKLLNLKLKVIIVSHVGRVASLESRESGKYSMKIPFEEAQRLLHQVPMMFIDSLDFGVIKQTLNSHKNDCDVFVLQNSRYYDVDNSGKKVNLESGDDKTLGGNYASLADYYVDDAYGLVHRKAASNHSIVSFFDADHASMGLLMVDELTSIYQVLGFDPSKQLFIFGGAKVSDKLSAVKKILPTADKVLIGGAMSYTFLVAQGKDVGKSLVEKDMIEECKKMLEQYGDKIVLPVDHLTAPKFEDVPPVVRSVDDRDWNDYMALDIGPKTKELFLKYLIQKAVVIWNGPMGVFEFSHYSSGTEQIFSTLVELTKQKLTYSFVGGGDTASAAKAFGVEDELSWVSTGGGATLSMMSGSVLDALEVLPDKK